MKKTLLISGVPRSLMMDGWWLDAEAPDSDRNGAAARLTRDRWPSRVAGILFLVVIGDLLFWGHKPGLSFALFTAAIFVVAVRGVHPRRALARPAMLLLLAALPVIDHLQFLSLGFLVSGLVAALIWAHHPDIPARMLAGATARSLSRLPLRWIEQLYPWRIRAMLARLLGKDTSTRCFLPFLRNWAFPLGGGLVFATLLMDANPVLERFARPDLDMWPSPMHLLFWVGIAVFVAPLLAANPAPQIDGRGGRALPMPQLGVNSGSVLRALLLFNLLIGAQSLTDLSILIVGAELPAGMTLAEYAHRGAYPLLATAILAGLFALAARPFLAEHRLIRPLMLLWLAQNMVLCGAAALRLDLYIRAFGLTYLRLYALIWMALIAAGLGLALWQALRGHDNGWLMRRAVVMAAATLYVCSFINFAQIIAAQNVTRSNPDLIYLCELGPMAAGPIVESGVGTAIGSRVDLGICGIRPVQSQKWRGWGFRSWSVNRYLDRVTTPEPANEDPDRR